MSIIRFITHENIHMPGARVRCYNMAYRLSQRGWDAKVISLHDLFGKPYTQLSDTEMMLNSLRLFRLLSLESPGTILYVQRINYHSLAPYLIHLAKNMPLILDCDDWDFDVPIFRSLRYLPGFNAQDWLKKFLRVSSGCVASSHALQEYLREFQSKVTYIPTGVDVDTFVPDKKKADNKLLRISWLGTVFRKDNLRPLQLAIQSFAKIYRQEKNCTLEILSTGNLISEIRRRVEIEYADVDIKFLPWQSPENIPNYLASVDIGLLPLVPENRFNQCKSPTKLFEYMAMEIPTVSSRVGEIKHVIEDGVDGFLASDKEEFISKMENLAGNHPLRRD